MNIARATNITNTQQQHTAHLYLFRAGVCIHVDLNCLFCLRARCLYQHALSQHSTAPECERVSCHIYEQHTKPLYAHTHTLWGSKPKHIKEENCFLQICVCRSMAALDNTHTHFPLCIYYDIRDIIHTRTHTHIVCLCWWLTWHKHERNVLKRNLFPYILVYTGAVRIYTKNNRKSVNKGVGVGETCVPDFVFVDMRV